MATRNNTSRFFMIFSTLVASSVIGIATAAPANPMVERTKLEQMAEAAKTPKEHVTVAKQFRLQAEEFEQKAARHESEAQRLAKAPRSPLEHKWPAMSRQPWIKERQLAMEARRAAQECLEASARHMRLSVETLADAADRNTSRSSNLD